MEPSDALWPNLKEELWLQVRVAAANELKSKAQCGTRGRRPPGTHKWRHCLKLHAIKEKKNQEKKENQTT